MMSAEPRNFRLADLEPIAKEAYLAAAEEGTAGKSPMRRLHRSISELAIDYPRATREELWDKLKATFPKVVWEFVSRFDPIEGDLAEK